MEVVVGGVRRRGEGWCVLGGGGGRDRYVVTTRSANGVVWGVMGALCMRRGGWDVLLDFRKRGRAGVGLEAVHVEGGRAGWGWAQGCAQGGEEGRMGLGSRLCTGRGGWGRAQGCAQGGEDGGGLKAAQREWWMGLGPRLSAGQRRGVNGVGLVCLQTTDSKQGPTFVFT